MINNKTNLNNFKIKKMNIQRIILNKHNLKFKLKFKIIIKNNNSNRLIISNKKNNIKVFKIISTKEHNPRHQAQINQHQHKFIQNKNKKRE